MVQRHQKVRHCWTSVEVEVKPFDDPASSQKHLYGDSVKGIEGRAPKLRILTIQLGRRLNVLEKSFRGLITQFSLTQFIY